MTSGKTGILAAVLSIAAIAAPLSMAAIAALAHSGATGIVLERMNGMTAMRDIIGELAPMMQGAVPYDVLTVAEGGDIIAKHAGETMLALFPEGSLQGVTFAKPEIWAKWQDFADLSGELRIYAEAMSKAAPNGLEPAVAAIDPMAGMDHSAMAMPSVAPGENGFTVAELMGYATQPETVPVLASGEAIDLSTPLVDLTAMAADDLFEQVSGTCSSCHAQFRAGRD